MSKAKDDGGLGLGGGGGGGDAKKRFASSRTRASGKSVHDTYRRMSGVEHILHRPELYVGMVAPVSEVWWIPFSPDASNQRMVRRNITFSPALFKIFDEIVVNAADNKMRCAAQTRVDVSVNQATGAITVYNDGAGIPVVMHKKYKMYIPRLIFGHLLTSSNYDDKEEKITGGRHGYGAKLTNVFSKHFQVETASKGVYFEKSWSKNMTRAHTEHINTRYSGGDFTRITFIPDLARFQGKESTEKNPRLTRDIISLIQRRTFDIGATCGVEVTWNGKKAEHVDSFLDYVITFLPRGRVRVLSSVDLTIPAKPARTAGRAANDKANWGGAGGKLNRQAAALLRATGETDAANNAAAAAAADALALTERAPVAKKRNINAEVDGSWACPLTHTEEDILAQIKAKLLEGRAEMDREVLVFHQRSAYYDVVLAFHMDGDVDKNDHIAFVNNVATHNGGTHLKHVQDVVLELLLDFVPGRSPNANKIKDLTRVLRGMLQVFVSAIVPNPTFGSQIKDKLITPLTDFKTQFKVHNLTRYAFRASDLAARIVTLAEREMGLAISASKLRGTRIFGRVNLPKLEDANWAGTKQSHLCTLILTEGDSAKALAVSGLAVVGRDKYGVFPLKGKLLNAREATLKKVAENDQLADVMKAMGLRFDEVYTSPPELRYGRIMIMADQDHDGSHIKGLFMNFIHAFWPSLLNIDGFITQFVTPIVKALPARSDSTSVQPRAFFALSDFQKWRAALSAHDARRYHIKYYKGLGTSTSAEGREYFSSIEKHSIEMVRHLQPRQDDSAMELAFSAEMIEARKVWVSSYSVADHLGVDFRRKKLTFFDFVHKELILYSVADCERSIPSFIDGLKPSQRKVLYGCFKRNLTRSMKVEALGGYISEQTAYHHGEKSLHDTIINLAQDFLGANNLPLLVPDGQFGTRHEGGRDHASARYIFTHLAPVTRLLFPAADDVLLRYKDDDGFPIEPIYYVPVIPLVLVNGASGIGTGFATTVPQYNPLDVIDNVRRLLRGEKPEHMTPWHEGFTGTYELAVDLDTGEDYHWTTNVIYWSGKETLTISDLAPGVTTSSVKTQIVKLVQDEFIRGFTENHTPSTVLFSLDISKEATQFATFDADTLAEQTAAAEGKAKASDGAVAVPVVDEKKSAAKTLAAQQDAVVDQLARNRFGRATYRTKNMYGFDRTGTMRLFHTTDDILEEHFSVRLKLYQDRFAHMEAQLVHQLEVEESRYAFLHAVCKGAIKLATLRDEAALLAYLKAKKMARHFPPSRASTASSVASSGGAFVGTQPHNTAEPDHTLHHDPGTTKSLEPSGSSASVSSAASASAQLSGYEYLMRMPISSFNKEHVQRTADRIEKIKTELAKHRAKTPNRLFHEDLDALEACIKDYYAKREQQRREERPKSFKPPPGSPPSSSSSSSSSGGGGGGGGSGATQKMSNKIAQKQLEKLMGGLRLAVAEPQLALPTTASAALLARFSAVVVCSPPPAAAMLSSWEWWNTTTQPQRRRFAMPAALTADRAAQNVKSAVVRMLPRFVF